MKDLEQHMMHMLEIEHFGKQEPKPLFQCVPIHRAEAEVGTEMPAIIGQLFEYTASQSKRIRDEKYEEERLPLYQAALERGGWLLS